MNDTVTAIVVGRSKRLAVSKMVLRAPTATWGLIAMEQETWEGDKLRFRMRAFGQTAAGSIEVLEDALRIEVSLPWLLAKAAKGLLPMLHREATLLLEKK